MKFTSKFPAMHAMFNGKSNVITDHIANRDRSCDCNYTMHFE